MTKRREDKMNTSIHNAIKSEYERRQKEAYDNLMFRKKKAYAEIAGLEAIEDEIHRTGLRYNKMILLGKTQADDAVSELLSQIDSLKRKKIQLLVENGYPEDYLEIKYSCPKCKDTGYIEGGSGAVKCSCYKQQLINQLYSYSNLKLTERENFSTFNENLYSDKVDKAKYGIGISPRENILRIKERCLKFIENFDSPDEKNLFFSGPTGVGKTFMSNCIAMELMKRGKTVLYQTAPIIFNIINEYKVRAFNDDDFQDESYKSIFDAELLIIDDLGTETQSAARYAELLTILNVRQMNNLQRPCKIIISTNIGPKKLYEIYTERVASRIIGCFEGLMFVGDDLRKKL